VSAPSAAYALVGRIRKAHGIRGELVVEPVTDQPEAYFAPGCRLFAGDANGDPLPPPPPPGGRRDPAAPPMTLTVKASRTHQEAVLVTLDVVPDRTIAEQWRGRTLLVPADELHEPAEGEVFLHELAGMAAFDEAGNSLGDVSDWYEVPQGILLGITRDGKELLVPFVDEIVIELDREARRLVLRLPDGLGE
jgi:16S rRNA processing protein RimM